ncbi:anthranilate synthase component II [Rhodohalobacter mucosus]|uniref:Anthranilate/aminodeoxychorismate synthase component II n=1 Tax=Rhodohalobacter mucosus TaxID=2079485 RepID=A0A316TSF6_9BACT|nr:aminodeoxychorismate/anthranilate synthase component II [Rhodohalobacter mucosus]PWN07507.1 anthranilate/aminodeoxychorismate synthase component II [Rhodohalobacter mucosus]
MILIIDNYDSFTYNLVHIVAGVTDEYRVIRNDDLTIEEIRELKPNKILISPGPGRPEDAGVSEEVIRELGPDIPVLGVCLGHQAIGQVFGARVVHAPSLMHGKTSEVFHDRQTIYEDVPDGFTATRYHSLALDPDSVPEDQLTITSTTKDGVIMGVRHKIYPIEGIQFHPESILTVEGPKIVRNWLQKSLEKAAVG